MFFFAPLGASFFLISITHSLFNAALSRLPSPEIYLAGFTVAKSLLQVLQNPVAMIRQTMVALINDSKSYFKVRRFIITLVSSLVLVFTVLSFTSASRIIFKYLIGVEGEVLEQAIIILRVFILFPAAVALRNFMQGIAIKFRKTFLTSIATIARVAFVAVIVLFVDKLMFIPPGILAGLMFLGAICVEAITMFLGVKFTTKNIPESLDKLNNDKRKVYNNEISYRLIITFFTPLLFTSFFNSLTKPIIDSGLARTTSAEVAISAFAVAWGLGVMVISPLMMFHQVPMNFIETADDKKSVKKFALILGIASSVLLGVLGFSPIGYYIMSVWIKASNDICVLAGDVIKLMTLLPLIIITRQYYWGVLTKKHKTKYVSYGKFVNLSALFISIFIGGLLLNPANPAIIGVIGRICGEGFETLYLYWSYKRI